MAKSMDHMLNLLNEIPRNAPHLDSHMFLRHNVTQTQEPPNLTFEASPIWHDDELIVTDEAAKVFLRNLLSKSKTQVRELRVEADKHKREVDSSRRNRERARQGQEGVSEVDVVRTLFHQQEAFHEIDRKRVAAEVETSTIMAVVGDLSVGAQNHNFKSQTFKIPTNCDLCGERIWGLSAKGFDCRDCGYTCHSKCEMKVPAECPGKQSKEEKKRLKAERQEQATSMPPLDLEASTTSSAAPSLTRKDTMNSLSSGYATNVNQSVSNVTSQPASGAETPISPVPPVESKPAPVRRVLAPPPAAYISPPPEPAPKPSEPRGRMLYPYQAQGEDEVSVQEGDSVVIVEPDGKPPPTLLTRTQANKTDGSGWLNVRSGTQTGLVPASYVEAAPAPAQSPVPSVTDRRNSVYSNSSAAGHAPGKKIGPAVAPRRGAKKLQYVEAMYDYTARSEMEWDMAEGDRFVLVNRDGGDGWADVERGGVTKSVPANYIQEV